MTKLGESFKIGGTAVTYGSLVTLALFAFIWFVLNQTTWGRRVYALGDNPEATRLMGIPVRKQLLMVYVVAGAIYGIAALLLVARTNVGDPNAGLTDNLDAITAVVLGGTSLFGGRGTIIGTLIGALIIGVCATASSSWASRRPTRSSSPASWSSSPSPSTRSRGGAHEPPAIDDTRTPILVGARD